MKTIHKPAILACAAAVAFVTFFACTKETSPHPSGKAKAPVTATEKVQQIGGTLTVGTSCGSYRQCSSLTLTPGAGYNQITFTKDASTVTYYPTLRYSIYEQSSTTPSQYNRITEFTCTNTTMTYSNIALNNTTQYILVITDGSVPFTTPTTATYNPPYGLGIATPEIPFTTGTGKTKSC